MRKIISVILIMAFFVSLVSCSNETIESFEPGAYNHDKFNETGRALEIPGILEFMERGVDHGLAIFCFRYVNKHGYETNIEIPVYETDYMVTEILAPSIFYELNTSDEKRRDDMMKIIDVVLDFYSALENDYDKVIELVNVVFPLDPVNRSLIREKVMERGLSPLQRAWFSKGDDDSVIVGYAGVVRQSNGDFIVRDFIVNSNYYWWS